MAFLDWRQEATPPRDWTFTKAANVKVVHHLDGSYVALYEGVSLGKGNLTEAMHMAEVEYLKRFPL
jgi:hypothetical protein